MPWKDFQCVSTINKSLNEPGRPNDAKFSCVYHHLLDHCIGRSAHADFVAFAVSGGNFVGDV